MRYWKQPKEKVWFSLVVDGKTISTVEDSRKLDKDRKRLDKLSGIIFRMATLDELVKVNARTFIPQRIIDKMESFSKNQRKSF